ncbi:MAG: NUDIX domain-containing protein [Ruminococcaceae bacterium]|nr:NUDIX domain-containing protein [Oscillospiraceae bacterium]
MHYIYCPVCGTKLGEKVAGDDGNVPYCENCEKYWFDSFESCVIILIANEYNELAMLRQNYMSPKYWTYVSGFMKPGETAEETAQREVYEELGLKVDRLFYGGTYWFSEHEQLMHGFIGFTKKAAFTLSKEVDDARWVPYTEAPDMMFPEKEGNSQQPMYRKYLEIIKRS